METKERIYGLDLYRLMAMLMITSLHVNFQFFSVISTPDNDLVSTSGFLIAYICFCGVNCFALLTGYLSNGTPVRYDQKWFIKTVDLWAKIVAVGLIAYFPAIYLLSVPFSWKCIYYIFCIRGGVLWYVGAYLGLLIFLPLISGFCSRFSFREQALFFVISFITFSVLPIVNTVPQSFNLADGYSLIWLMICFCWGQNLKTFANEFLRWKYSSILLLAGTVLGIMIPFLYHRFTGSARFMNYISPFCVMEAICLLLLFTKLKIKSGRIKKTVSFLSTYSLGIYLLQAQHIIWYHFLERKVTKYETGVQLLWKFPAMVLLISVSGFILYYLVCLVFSIPKFKSFRETFYSFLMKILLLGSHQEKERK